jgi:hypothetical protein
MAAQRRRAVVLISCASMSSRRATRAIVAALWRLLILAFALHASGVGHLLADLFFDDDLTCIDERSGGSLGDREAPRCPASLGIGCGHAVAPASRVSTCIAMAPGHRVPPRNMRDVAPPPAPPRGIERPPKG